MPARVLVLEDEGPVRENVVEVLRLEGYEAHGAQSGEQARLALDGAPFDLFLVDRRLPDGDGIDFLVDLRRSGCEAPAIVITGHPSLDTAVQALRHYCFDYLTKPFASQELVGKVKAALGSGVPLGDNAYFRDRLRERFQFDCVLSRDRRTQEAHLIAMKVADSGATMLIEGESGTGKEYLAKSVHYASNRRQKPMVCLNCAALPESLVESELFGHEKGAFTGALGRKLGLFEVADGGTLLLDEIGDISPAIQAKLLRFLQDKTLQRLGGTETIQVDVRVIAATNRRLLDAVRAGKFRQDLYYRLSVVPLWLPPLRERREDIGVFLRHFLNKHGLNHRGSAFDITDDAAALLVEHDWPGNIRELENCVQRAVLLATTSVVRRQDLLLEPADPEATSADLSLATAERRHIEEVLRRTQNHRGRAARLLKLDPSTLRSKLKTYALEDQLPLL
jgi:two-component system response regulator AtoC